MDTYKVIRRFFSDHFGPIVIKECLSLEEAQEHCRDPEASSTTAVSVELVELTKNCGHWFDGYVEE